MYQRQWPPNSLDLSPIENLWGWMEQQSGNRVGINNTDDLQCRLIAIRSSITLTQLRDLFDGMDARTKLIVKLQGGHKQVSQAQNKVHVTGTCHWSPPDQ